MSEAASAVDQGRRAIESDGPLMETAEGESKLIGGDSFPKRTPNPSWLADRNTFYETIKERRAEEAKSKYTPVEISVTMPDGTVMTKDKEGKPFLTYRTTPFHVAATISQGLADSSTVARVTYEKYADDYDPAFDGMNAKDTLEDAMDDLDLEDNSAEEKEENNDETASGGLKPQLWDLTRPLVGPVKRLELLKFNDDQEAKTVFWHSSAHMMGEAMEHLFGVKLTIGPPLKGGFYYDSYMGVDSIKEDDCELI
jgi:threonyl-tRNA synthetase